MNLLKDDQSYQRRLHMKNPLSILFLMLPLMLLQSCGEKEPAVVLAEVSTETVTAIRLLTAISGGNVISDGGGEIKARGICWSINENPLASLNTRTIDGKGMGSYTSSISGLTDGATYYVRAYATNSAGTAYGQNVVFTATSDGQSGSFTDSRDGRVYKTVKIGKQVWMAENLAWLPSISGPSQSSGATPHYYVYGYSGTTVSEAKSTSNYQKYGVLYNWPAIMNGASGSVANPSGIRGVCPTGWHLPSDAEWTQLADYLGGAAIAGGKLKEAGISNWQSPNTGATNESEFSALPGGYYNALEIAFGEAGSSGLWWTATSSVTESANYRDVLYNTVGVRADWRIRADGYSLRCVEGEGFLLASVGTREVTLITTTTARSGGVITSSGGAAITERGLCWSTEPNPTTSLETKTINGAGTGTFTSNLTGLTPGTTYYIRSYAINSVGTAYGEELSFLTTAAALPTLTTTSASNITTVSASSGGQITSDGGMPVTARGICWSDMPNPTIALETKTINGAGTGTFTSSMTGLAVYTKYYVRAYATNYAGTAYGPEISFTTLDLSAPSHYITAVTILSPTSATVDCHVTYDGGMPVTARGVIWSTSSNPTIDLPTKTTDGAGIGTFTTTITGLAPGTKYYFRSYATNSIGTSYGGNWSRTTTTFVPVVTTATVTSIGGTIATGGGSVSSEGEAPVTARGVCWSTSSNPTVDLPTKTVDGSGPGPFTSNITGLSPLTIYYIRAYATNSFGTSYGPSSQFITKTSMPSLTTGDIAAITTTTATGGGNVSFEGDAPVSERGVCWSTSSNPTIDLPTKTLDGAGSGSFISNITGLTPGTSYFVRAYATNSFGTTYGLQKSFTTLHVVTDIVFNSGVTYGSVTDIDGNVYRTVQVGTRTWMAENLKTTRYNDGTPLPHVTDGLAWNALTSAAYSWYLNSEVTYKAVYGAIYNWYAVSETNPKNVCPTGWHVPSILEFESLSGGGDLKETGTTHWESPNTGATNNTGFTGLPGGYRLSGSFLDLGKTGMFWSSTADPLNPSMAKARRLGYDTSHFGVSGGTKSNGWSVRCIKDE
jgi:uncharacterized protein (TIGR02145 family)